MSKNALSIAARWCIFAAILVADVLDLLSTTVTNIAAPSIVADLHAPQALTPWLGSSYALALGSILVIGGRLGDKYGYRRLFLIGLVGFTTASALCALAWDPVSIVTARIIQGAFGALLIPQGFSILIRVFPREELGRVFGLFGPIMGLSSISGPVLAGLLIQTAPFGLGWRSVFLINVVLGLGLLAVSTRFLPRYESRPGVRIDAFAAAALMAGTLAALAGIIQGGNSGWNVFALALIAAGAVLLAVFVVHQRHSENPLLAPALFRNRSFVAGLFVGAVFFAAVAGLLFVTSLYLQEGRHLRPLAAAGIMAPMSVGIIIASFSARGVIQRLGRGLVALGLALVELGTISYLLIVTASPAETWVLVFPLFVCGLGMGCCFGSVFAVALGNVDEDQTGSASGTLNAVQQIANSIGAAIVSTIFLATVLTSRVQHAATTSLTFVLLTVLLCACFLPLLPKTAAPDNY
ncbi:MFS transporter [Leifsonia poae]|uniref:MFS transporter n=1 Tax=Leifsonia poae TaxID=110933 RepID=UPI001CBFDF58|nr:MFS transporter [Leifsonia poae]